MLYPSHLVKLGEPNRAIVTAIAAELRKWGYVPTSPAGLYDANLSSIVKLFQSQHSDPNGRPLKVDGQVGPLTWGTLFRSPQAAPPRAKTIGKDALQVAIAEIGVRESPPGSNSGPKVDQYLSSVGLNGGYFWCMAFVHWSFAKAASNNGLPNPWPRDAGCVSAWGKLTRGGKARIITRAEAVAKPGLVEPGMVFIHDYGRGCGHTGFVRSNNNGALKTVEGNADPQGGSNGLEVLEVNRRSVMDRSLKGFVGL